MRAALLCWLLLGLLTSGITRPGLGEQASTRRGEALLTANCARCHAVGRSGASAHPEAPPFRTLSRKFKIEGLAEALAEGIFTGHPDMPEFVFEPDEVGAIIHYLQSIQQRWTAVSRRNSARPDSILDPSQNSASSIVAYVPRGTAAGEAE